MNLMEKQYRPWRNGEYMVSQDGYMYRTETRNGAFAGQFARPFFSAGSSRYNIRTDGSQSRVVLATLVEDVWGIIIKYNEDMILEMRRAIDAHHEAYLPQAFVRGTKPKGDPSRNSFSMPCPWETGKLDTLPTGVASWDCPEMDPMGCGTARVALKIETEQRERRAA